MRHRSNFNQKLAIICVLGLFVFVIVVGCSPKSNQISTQDQTKTPDVVDATKTPTPGSADAEGISATQTQIAIDSSQAINIAPADLSGISIRFAHPFGGKSTNLLIEIAREFSLTNPWGIWVDVEDYGSETAMVSALQIDFENGNLPELFAIHPYELAILGDDFGTIDLMPYFQDSQWGFPDEAQEDFYPVFLEQFSVDEQLIALPFAPQAVVNFYNRSWANELGFSEVPQDEIEFREQSEKATRANLADLLEDNDGTGGWIINNDPRVLASWFHAFGGDLVINATPNFDNEAGQEAFNYLKSVYDEGYFWISRQPDPYEYFANRYVLTYAGTLDQIPTQEGWMSSRNNQDAWTVFGFPGPDGVSMFVDGLGLMVREGTPEEQLAAWLFVKHLSEPAIQAKWVQQMFTLPVRESTMDVLVDFGNQHPQWLDAVNMIDRADPFPISEGWGIAQWVLQDAAYRIFPGEISIIEGILETLDATVKELEAMTP